jgi:hypothetical protein
MNLYEKIIKIYPELTDIDFNLIMGKIQLQDASDGRGAYIAKWEHPTLSKPTDEQLAGI